MILYYLAMIALFEVMVYMAIRIAHVIFVLADSPEDNVNCREVSPEEFEKVMRELFDGDNDE